MESKQQLEAWLTAYEHLFADEALKLRPYIDYLPANRVEDLFVRSNFNGHITASAFIFNDSFTEMLMIKHAALGRWLQPGGHIEPGDESLWQAALREAVEETGISKYHLTLRPLPGLELSFPFDIDPHWIPEHVRKQEPGHFHHDHRFVFTYSGDGSLDRNLEETDAIRWVPINELMIDDTFGAVIRKIRMHFPISN